MSIVLSAVGAYLVGCVPAARLGQKLARGPRSAALAPVAADVLKGFASVALFTQTHPLGLALVATAAMAGHQWPAWGRPPESAGMSAAAGILTAVTPVAVPVMALTWGLAFVVTGYISAGYAVATALLPLLAGWLAGWPIGGCCLPVAVMLLDRLRPSMRRMLLGTESRYDWRGGA